MSNKILFLLFFLLLIAGALILKTEEFAQKKNDSFFSQLLSKFDDYKKRRKDDQLLEALTCPPEKPILKTIKETWKKEESAGEKWYLKQRAQTSLSNGKETDISIQTSEYCLYKTFAAYLSPEDPLVEEVFENLKKNDLLFIEDTNDPPKTFSIMDTIHYRIYSKKYLPIYLDYKFNIVGNELNKEDRDIINNSLKKLYVEIINKIHIYYNEEFCDTKTSLSKGKITDISFFTTPYHNHYFFNEYLLPDDPTLNKIICIVDKYSEKFPIKKDIHYSMNSPLPQSSYCLKFGNKQIQLDEKFNILSQKEILEEDRKPAAKLFNELKNRILKEGNPYYLMGRFGHLPREEQINNKFYEIP